MGIVSCVRKLWGDHRMDIKDNIRELLKRIERERKNINYELKHMPKGVLVISTNGPDRISYFNRVRTNSGIKLKGVGSDKNLMYRLARKAYLKEYRERLEFSAKVLIKTLAELPELNSALYLPDMPKHFELLPWEEITMPVNVHGLIQHPVLDGSMEPEPIATVFTGDSPRAWAEAPFCANNSYPEDKIHLTSSQVFCRSKSEAATDEIYCDLEIPHHYDECLSIQMELISPDFRGIRQDNQFLYHEHLGIKSLAYTYRLARKLKLYAEEGIVLGKNLLLTCDNEFGGINLSLIRAQIRDFYRLQR